MTPPFIVEDRSPATSFYSFLPHLTRGRPFAKGAIPTENYLPECIGNVDFTQSLRAVTRLFVQGRTGAT